MSKIRTLEQLQQALDDDLAWRKKELAIIKSLVNARSKSTETINCHIRSGVALTYAHWEGFIKTAGTAYLTYIATQGLTYAQLANNFVAISTKKLLNEANGSNKFTVYSKVVELFTSGLNAKCNFSTEVETKSNLSSEVLREIMHTLGLDFQEYITKSKLIDEVLLKNRNNIAHGRFLVMDVSEFLDLHQTIINLLDLFSNQISNAAITKAYQKPNSNLSVWKQNENKLSQAMQ